MLEALDRWFRPSWSISLLLVVFIACSDVTSPTVERQTFEQLPGLKAALSATQVDKLTADDGDTFDRMGTIVDFDGDIAVIGATGDEAAYVFERSGTNWTQAAKLTAEDGATGDLFGAGVAVTGNTIAVGSPFDDDNGSNSGSAYVFKQVGDSWVQATKLTPSDGAGGDFFGWMVSADDDVVLAGAPLDESGIGSAYVFDGSTGWTETKLTASDGAAGDVFGIFVSVNDGLALIGAQGGSGNVAGSGSAYVFERVGGGWSEAAKLTASDGAAGDGFGTGVDIKDGVAVVGAPLDDDDGEDSGSAYVFDGSAGWSEITKLTAGDGALEDQFGMSVAIEAGVVVAGAPHDDDQGEDSGSAYVFDQSAGWSQVTKLAASDGAEGDGFGFSVVSSGSYAVVGAPNSDAVATQSGSAYVFDLTEQLIQVAIDIKPGGDPNSINVNYDRGVIPVAIRGSAEFDVRDVDVTTLNFGDLAEDEGTASAHDLTDLTTYEDHIRDVNGDGIDDLVSHYSTPDTGIDPGDTEACIEGETDRGTPLEGCDSVRTVPGS